MRAGRSETQEKAATDAGSSQKADPKFGLFHAGFRVPILDSRLSLLVLKIIGFRASTSKLQIEKRLSFSTAPLFSLSEFIQ